MLVCSPLSGPWTCSVMRHPLLIIEPVRAIVTTIISIKVKTIAALLVINEDIVQKSPRFSVSLNPNTDASFVSLVSFLN